MCCRNCGGAMKMEYDDGKACSYRCVKCEETFRLKNKKEQDWEEGWGN